MAAWARVIVEEGGESNKEEAVCRRNKRDWTNFFKETNERAAKKAVVIKMSHQ